MYLQSYQSIALLKVYMFRIGAEIFGSQNVRIQNFKARRQALQKVNLSLLAVCFVKNQYMYEYIIETETPLSELKTFSNCKGT